LIDAGIAKTKIEKRLLEAGIRPDEIAAIFITHAHADHIKGLPLANKYRIPVYASEGTWKTIRDSIHQELQNIGGVVFDYGCAGLIKIKPFRTYHDDYDSNGYTISDEKSKVSICIDTGKIDSEMLEAMKDSDIYIIEANHDEDMVQSSDYPDSVKARILSEIGHLSNQQAAYALYWLVKGRGERIYLTHLSKVNNMPKLAQMTVEAELRKKGLTNRKDYFLEVV
jgi:phosphoribosyl 1,2-cyclic phosphodiesterase